MLLVGGIVVGVTLLGGVRLVLVHRKGDPDPPQHTPWPVSVPWWERPVWALVVLGLLVVPFAVFWLLRRGGPAIEAPPSAPSLRLSGPPTTSGGTTSASPAIQPTMPTDPTLWRVLVVLGLAAVTVIAV